MTRTRPYMPSFCRLSGCATSIWPYLPSYLHPFLLYLPSNVESDIFAYFTERLSSEQVCKSVWQKLVCHFPSPAIVLQVDALCLVSPHLGPALCQLFLWAFLCFDSFCICNSQVDLLDQKFNRFNQKFELPRRDLVGCELLIFLIARTPTHSPPGVKTWRSIPGSPCTLLHYYFA
jgi:hypothetical protein